MSIKVREANISDKKDIYDWRNDLDTRKMFHTEKFITWEEHCEWFLNFRKINFFLIVCLDLVSNKKIAVLNFKIINNEAIVSINLNPKERGKKFGSICLKLGIEFFLKRNNHIKAIKSEIKSSNFKSKKIFINNNFVIKYKRKNIEYFEFLNNFYIN